MGMGLKPVLLLWNCMTAMRLSRKSTGAKL